MSRRLLIAGNWKMNGSPGQLDFFQNLRAAIGEVAAELLICPPFPLIPGAIDAATGTGIAIGAQDCHAAVSGAHTGDVSASLLAELGVTHVILGHSERRSDHGETSQQVCAKAERALAAGLIPIVCVGESLEERRSGSAEAVVAKQVDVSVPKASGVVIAYEPVWAIGSGLTAELEDITAMHALIRSRVEQGEDLQILYGGSVKPANARDILALSEVDGALIGGASLTVQSLGEVIKNTSN